MKNVISHNDLSELKKIAIRSTKIKNRLLIYSTILTPKNLTEETEKFFKSKSNNPQFKYKKLESINFDREIDELEKFTETLDLPDELFYHLIDYLNNLRLLYHTRRSVGKTTFPIYSKLFFNWDIKSPESVLKDVTKPVFQNEEKKTLRNATEIRDQLQNTLNNKYKMPSYKVKVSELPKNIIFVKANIIYIGNGIKRFQNNVDRLIVHEVESHLIQNHNIKILRNPLLRLTKLSDSELYAEGLAVYNEITSKTITQKAFNNYYFRLKAVNNLNLSFREIYEMLVTDGLSTKQAFYITYRVKRGMTDTGRPGGYPKDAAYLLGYKAVLDFLKENKEETMYYSKNPEVTKLLMKYGLLKKKNLLLPKFKK
jgi:hypothetical protein